jgi:hypothetical protein
LPILAEAARSALGAKSTREVEVSVGGQKHRWQLEPFPSAGLPSNPEVAGRKDAQPAALHQ